MAIQMALHGGLGIIHYNMPIGARFWWICRLSIVPLPPVLAEGVINRTTSL